MTTKSVVRRSALIAGAGIAAALAGQQVGCSSPGVSPGGQTSSSVGPNGSDQAGTVGMKLTLPGGETVNSVNWTITGPNGSAAVVQSGSVDVSNSQSVSFQVAGLLPGSGYAVSLTATSTDGLVTCAGSASFSIFARSTTTVTDVMQCNPTPGEAGSAMISAPTYNCAAWNSVAVSPSETTVGHSVAVSASATGANPSGITYAWSAPAGSGNFSAPSSASTNFTCAAAGSVTLTLTVGDGPVPDGGACNPALTTTTVQVTCDLLTPASLVISSTTYDASQGAVASLVVGTALPHTATATIPAVAGNDYVNVWNNDTADGSFGVTSAIRLTDIDPNSGHVFSTVSVPTNQVVTSFSSKSELGLHYVQDSSGAAHIVFVAYAGAGVGALDVSNSDAVPGQDPTNPVTFAFGSNYAFARTIVSMDMLGNFSYTPTIDYGGNNGRSALLGSNGLYYAVGNSNNGNAAAFGPNGTTPDVTETTGLEVVTPINGSTSNVAIPANNSAEVDPLIQYNFTDGGKADKAGKDNNYRGVTEYGGALYFTKGSGGNGMDTVYTVSPLPTVANAASATITVVPGFPTDSAKATNGNFTPFGVFFGNPTTMYVADEGTGNSTDVSSHAGLEKWSLVNGTWQLDYVLTNGLIGTVDANLGADGGASGPWPSVTTIGLRNLTGVVNQATNTVTLWATTSTSSTSGDNGADPNKVVTITDQLGATTASAVAGESFSVVVGPTYGTVYRGVAYAN